MYERKICELIWNMSFSTSSLQNADDIYFSELSSLLYLLKREWKYAIFMNHIDDKVIYEEYLYELFCLIGYSRDIINGYGERDLSYRMIYVWYSVFPILSIFSLHTFFLPDNNGMLPYGCWKDFKYFCRLISNISTRGKLDPLIDKSIQIMNYQIDMNLSMIDDGFLTKAAIPKETGAFSWLFDRLVLDRDPLLGYKGFSKKQFRLDISSMKMGDPSPSLCHKEYYDKIFIGEYIRGILFGVSADWSLKWTKLVASFSGIYHSIPIIVLSAETTDELLYHMIGYTCLLSCIRGSSRRVLILSTTPIWLDISDKCDDIGLLVSEIWSYCKSRRTRTNWELAVNILMDAFSIHRLVDCPIQLFFFGSYFDLEELYRLKSMKLSLLILWKIGGEYNEIPKDFDMERILFLSGRSSALMRNFYQVYNSGDSYSWNSIILKQSRYDRLRNYFIEVNA